MAAKTIKFSGDGQAGNLLDPHNWAGGVAPGIDDTALITTNVGAPVAGTFSVNNIMLLGTERIIFTGTVDTAGVGNCKGLMVCDGAEAVFAPGAILNDGNVLIVGNDAVGTLVAQGSLATHSVINTASANLGKQDAGIGTVTIDDGIWRNSGNAVIGDDGAGTLDVINNGSVFVGGNVDMAANAGSAGKMIIASGGSVTVAGTLRVGGVASTAIASVSVASGSSLVVDNTLSVDTGSTVGLAGGTVSAGVTAGCIRTLVGGVISGFGTLAAPDGLAIQDAGIIRATGGTLDIAGNVSGTGSIQIASNSTAMLTGSSLKLASIAFIGPAATLSLAHGSDVTTAISGFSIGDIIAMANIDAVSFKASTGVLTLSENNAQVQTLHLVGSFTGDMFSVTQSAGVAMIALRHS